ncbi:MAG: hypothetical protein ACK44Y_17270, partial [Novosphingobium sp.]
MNENRRVAMKSARHQIATSKLLSREFVAEQLAKGSLETPIKSRPSAWSALDRIRPPFKTAIFDAGWVRAQNPGSGRITLGTYLAKRSERRFAQLVPRVMRPLAGFWAPTQPASKLAVVNRGRRRSRA